MKRIILFSQPTESNMETILDRLLPKEMIDKSFSYMPSNGTKGSEDYIQQWQNIVKTRHAQFTVIDNLDNGISQHIKLLDSNILLITGGNTFQLLHNLIQSGLDQTIIKFISKPDFILAGFSAGALVITPTIEICNLPNFDENIVGIKDLQALNIVDFEIFPHYHMELHQSLLQDYQINARNEVRPLTEDDYIVIDIK